MTTQLVRETIKAVAKEGTDPTEMYWFDASGCMTDKTVFHQEPILLHKPPFPRCMVCWEGGSTNYEKMRVWIYVHAEELDKGVVLAATRQPNGGRCVYTPPIIYGEYDGEIRWRPLYEDDKVNPKDVEMILGFMSAWYDSMSQRNEAYVPSVQQTFTNRRKIAQGKIPTYEWRTVTVEPAKPRQEAQGGTHASPRQHDRRGHLRRLTSGKTVWVKHCKVGSAKRGIIFHDYKIGETQ
jgi:hypothetical protein